MTDILGQIGTKLGSEIKNLDIRLSSAETAIVNLGGQQPPPTGDFTIEPVTWTNLTEINLSGEKLVNGDFSNTTQSADKFTATSTSNNCYARQVVSVNGTYVQSIEIKEALSSGTSSFMLDQYFSGITGRSRIRIDLNGSSDPSVSTLSYGDVNDVTITNLADDWYRISLEVTLNTGSAQIRFGALETGDEVFARNASLVANGTTTELLTNNSAFSSGWTLNNTTIAEGTGLSLDNWNVTSGTLDQTKLASGIVDGTGGAVAIQQIFSNGIATGTTLVCKATRNDLNTGSVYINALRANGTPWSSNLHIQPSDGYVEFTTTEIMYGLRLTTSHGTREVSDISLFQGEVAGGSVQTHTGGSIEKISGAGGYNAGASSVQKIDGQKDGYVQFQIGHATSSVKIGLVNQDSDFEVDNPWKMNFGGGHVDMASPFIADHTPYVNGDWFRIRHYSTLNEIHFQKRQTIYADDLDFCLNQACGLNPTGSSTTDHIFSEADRPLVRAKQSVNGMTEGEYYRIYKAKVADTEGKERGQVFTLDGTLVGWIARRDGNNTSKWEVQEELGEDYVTFYTHPVLSNGSDLYVDTSFHSVGARLNDVQIAYK